MSIGALQTNSFGGSSSVWEMLRESASPTTAPISKTDSIPAPSQADAYSRSPSQNIMSGLFADAPREESRYLTATMKTFSVMDQIKTDMNNQMYSLLDHFGGVNPSGTFSRYMEGNAWDPPSRAEVEEAAGQQADKEILEASKELLDEMKDELDQKAEEALSPEDSDNTENTGEGNTAETSDGAGDSGTTGAPESSDSDPSETPNEDLSASERPIDPATGLPVLNEKPSLTEIIAVEAKSVSDRQAAKSEQAEQAGIITQDITALSSSSLMARAATAYVAQISTPGTVHLSA